MLNFEVFLINHTACINGIALQSTGGVVSCCDKDGCNTGANIVNLSPFEGPAVSAGNIPGAPLVFPNGQQQQASQQGLVSLE